MNNEVPANQRNLGNICDEDEPNPAFLQQGALVKGVASHKQSRFSTRLCSRIILTIIGVALCSVLSRQAPAQVAFDCGCESASARPTSGRDPSVILPCQKVFPLLQTCPPASPAISELPDAPSAVKGPTTNAGLAPERSLSELDVRDLAIESYTGKEPKTIDRQFLVLNALLVVSAVADAESTLLCSRCREVNPLLGSHPTRQRVYAIGVPLTAFQIYLAYHYKRLSPTRNGVITGWKAFPIAFAAIHGLAAAHNFVVAH
jgi:hypothetical protein